VFGSSQCRHCSSIYLLTLIPILLLFIFNLTVTNGDVNAIFLYVNVIGINSAIFLPSSTPAFLFISIANLDLGFETCFYNGVTDYAKAYIELVVPGFLILMSIIIILASRYSIRIQRLTARKALPVLATLFLLSYAKVLRTVSYVLFYYLKLTELPSGETKLVWSVDTSATIFGLKFSMLFILCLILFIILLFLFFNIILLISRILSYFKFISRFKPLY